MASPNDHPEIPRSEVVVSQDDALSATRLVCLYETHAAELHRFVLGVTRDPELASDVLQATLAKAVEFGHTARSESFKGWLFRVALHEALAARRKRATREEGNRRLAALARHAAQGPDERLIRSETVEAVRQALDELPLEQRRVVLARMYEDKSFAEIAAESGLPLGTVLTRMRLALEKLRRHLRPGD